MSSHHPAAYPLSDDLLFQTDSYKVSQWRQFPPHTQQIYLYAAARATTFRQVVPFGLQAVLKRSFVPRITYEGVREAEAFYAEHFGRKDIFHGEGWRRLVTKHCGRLPLEIRALPEGMIVPPQTPLFTVTNTDPEFYWLPGWCEGVLLQSMIATGVATQTRWMRELQERYLRLTAEAPDASYGLYDFGFRGCSTPEESAMSGAGHLVVYDGTDNVPALRLVRSVYGATMAGGGTAASEHSTMTSWGRDGEAAAYGNMLDQFGSHLFACVSDSYDIYAACQDLWGGVLRERVLGMPGVLVVRPDSGEPTEVLPAVLEILYARFGGRVNARGYKVLNDKVRVIQGDGIRRETFETILKAVWKAGFSLENLTFGSGGGLLRAVTRDLLGGAIKASWALVDGEPREIAKSPVTQLGKSSVGGCFAVLQSNDGTVHTLKKPTPEAELVGDLLAPVFRDGQLLIDHTFAEIRERAELPR